MKRLMPLTIIMLLAIGVVHQEAHSQAQDARILIGVWEGRHQGPNIQSDAARLDFKEVEGRIVWTMRREGLAWNQRMEAQASGGIAKAELPVFELEGKYDSHSFRSPVGQSLRYTLTLKGETLEGSGIGVTGSPFPAMFTRRK